MTRITKNIQIEAPKTKVWETLSDLTTIQHYDPMVIQAHYTSYEKEGIGASRHCDLPEGTYVKERITAWQPGQGYTLDVYEDGMPESPFASQQAQFSLAENGDGTTVTLNFDYELKPGTPVEQQEMTQMWMDEALPGLLAGLKQYVETGEAVPAPAAAV